MDDSGVDITLLMGCPVGGCLYDAFWEGKKCGEANNENVLKAVKGHPDRLIGNVILDRANRMPLIPSNAIWPKVLNV